MRCSSVCVFVYGCLSKLWTQNVTMLNLENDGGVMILCREYASVCAQIAIIGRIRVCQECCPRDKKIGGMIFSSA